MKIDKARLNRNCWFEDEDGNEITAEQARESKGIVTYHHLFPLEITEHIDSYEWHPQTLLQKHLCRIRPIYRMMYKKHWKDKTYRHLFDGNTHIGGGNADVIIAMVNSGDYTLSEALYLWSQSCERCMNVLAYKYLNGKDGYEEYSEEWKKCNTVCDFCREEGAD